jgi:hypothetical protein
MHGPRGVGDAGQMVNSALGGGLLGLLCQSPDLTIRGSLWLRQGLFPRPQTLSNTKAKI